MRKREREGGGRGAVVGDSGGRQGGRQRGVGGEEKESEFEIGRRREREGGRVRGGEGMRE